MLSTFLPALRRWLLRWSSVSFVIDHRNKNHDYWLCLLALAENRHDVNKVILLRRRDCNLHWCCDALTGVRFPYVSVRHLADILFAKSCVSHVCKRCAPTDHPIAPSPFGRTDLIHIVHLCIHSARETRNYGCIVRGRAKPALLLTKVSGAIFG